MNLLQRFVRWLDRKANPVPRQRYFAGAAFSRLTGDWDFATTLSADQELKGDLKVLRGRSRQLRRDNAHIAGFVTALQDNVIGWQGIRLQARLRKPNKGVYHERENASIEDGWGRWGEPGVCTVDGQLSFCDLERLVLANWAVDGEVLLRRIPGFPNPFSYALQVLDPDQLDEQHTVAAGKGQNEVRMGVELNSYGRPVAYHLWSAHPSDHTKQRLRERVPANEILHLFMPLRPGQTRGLPLTTPILLDMKMLGGYTEAELTQARAAAATGGFFVTRGENADLYGPKRDSNTGTDRERLQMEMEPGLSRELPPGVEFQPWDPTHPNGNYEAFQKAILRTIARGLGVAYTTFAGDLEAVNYSSIRAGLLGERDAYRAIQRWFASHFHTPIYREWLRYAAFANQIALPTLEPDRWTACEWQFRGWPWVDPRNDIDAMEKAINLRVLSRQTICAEAGRDFWDTAEKIAEEDAWLEELGLEAYPAATPAQLPAAADPEDDLPANAGKQTNGNGNGTGRSITIVPPLSRRF